MTGAIALTALALIVAGQAVIVVRAARDLLAWRRARKLSDAPVPYWPATELSDEAVAALTAILFCPACPGDGECTCTLPCGEDACTGGFDPADAEFMEQLWKAGGADQ